MMKSIKLITITCMLMLTTSCIPDYNTPMTTIDLTALPSTNPENLAIADPIAQMIWNETQKTSRATYGHTPTPPIIGAYQWNYPDDAYYQNTRVDIIPNNHSCRNYRITGIIAQQTKTVYATACQMPDHTWKLMDSRFSE